jgi:hypothetical protein
LIDWKALAILRAAYKMPAVRFSDLQRVVQNPRTLALKLKKMESDRLIVKENGVYRLTSVGEEAARILEDYQKLVGSGLVLRNLDRIPHAVYVPLLRDYCELLWGSYEERLEAVVLFGSVARGDWKKESDIDLLVVVDGWDQLKEWERIEELSSLKTKLAKCGSYSNARTAGFYPAIHTLPLDSTELKDFRPLYFDISADGIVLFDREGSIGKFVNSVRDLAARVGTKRIVRPDGSFYWVVAPVRLGEVVELRIQP